MKGKKVFLIILIVALVAVAVYFISKKLKNKNGGETPGGGGTSVTGNTGGSKYTDDSFPLKKNSGGDHVKTIQRVCNVVSGNDSLLEVDGKWGSKTDAAVKKYLATDGSISLSDWNIILNKYNTWALANTVSSRNIALQLLRKDLPLT